MHSTSHMVRFAGVCLVVALASCGAGGDGSGGTEVAGTVVGAAGGTVVGPNGAQVVIPPGALTTDTTITVEQASAGAPELPSEFSSFGLMFAFTPHGTTFAVPVTVTVAFDPALVPVGVPPALYKTNAQNQWEQVANVTVHADSLSAQVTSFSWLQTGDAPLVRNDPDRGWTFVRQSSGGTPEINEGSQVGGKLYQLFEFGSSVFDIDGDGTLSLEAFSSADGASFWVSADAPHLNDGTNPNSLISSLALLDQRQSFIKRAPDATLQFVITEAVLEAVDFNGFVQPGECPWGYGSLDAVLTKSCDRMLYAHVDFTAYAYNDQGVLRDSHGAAVLNTEGTAIMEGRTGHWEFRVHYSRATLGAPSTPVWALTDFERISDMAGSSGGSHPRMRLTRPLTHDVDLSAVQVGEEFTVHSSLLAFAYNRRARESGIGAYLVDPAKVGGAVMHVAGLEPTNRPLPPPAAVTMPTPCTTGPNPAAGVLQFSAAAYALVEQPFAGRSGLEVTRTQGSTGAVSVTVTTDGGTALPGVHYTPVSTTVHFADGDMTPRTVPVDILLNSTTEPNTTVHLTLSDPGGCATLGAQSSAVLTIIDDDQVPPVVPSFSLGGTVTGLAGSGLVLTNSGQDLAVAGNGPFAFALPVANGQAYDVRVRTQPTNPLQVCVVSQGSGTIAGAAVDNVLVDCTTPPANGALDTSFGSGGKVSTAFGGDNSAMALQADGKLVMVRGTSDFALARYHPDGSLDASFGTGGMVTTDLGSSQDAAQAVVLQPDGKLVVVGGTVVGRTATNLPNVDFALVRYHADGSLDASFGTGGTVTTDFRGATDKAFAVTLQPDGKLVVVGDAGVSSPTGSSSDFGLARYHPDGSLDTSFGVGGTVTTDIAGAKDFARNVVVQANGALVVSGMLTIGSSAGLDHTGLACYHPDGSLDASFGVGGTVTLRSTRVSNGLALAGDGQLVLVGSVFVTSSTQFALMRLTATGSPDPGFGNAGTVSTAVSALDDIAGAVTLQADGKLVVAGTSANRNNRANSDFAVVRYNVDGSLDTSFGTGGMVTLDFFEASDGAENVLIQPDGKLVLGGFASNGASPAGFGLARVLP